MKTSEAMRLDLLLGYSVDLATRSIYFSDDIEQESVTSAIKAIHFFTSENVRAPITLWLFSYGGSLDSAMALYDTIRASRCMIRTIGVGAIASAAVLVLMAGDERFCMENVRVMQHHGTVSVDQRHDELMEATKAYNQQMERIYDVMAQHSNQTASFWKGLIKKRGEAWLTVQELIEYDAIDGIIQPQKIGKKR